MTPPDADGMTLLGKLLIAGGTVAAAMVVPVLKARSWVEKKLDTKADKSVTDQCIKHIEKLYENAETDRKLTRDLFEEAVRSSNANHRDLVNLLLQHVNHNGAKQ